MQIKAKSILSWILILVMLLGVFASCDAQDEITTDAQTDEKTEVTTQTEKETKEENESSSEVSSETETSSEKEETIAIEGENAALITKAHELKNGVTPYYSDAAREEVTIDNTTMSLGYRIKNTTQSMQVSHLSTPEGKNYITDTMDVFLKMKNGKTYYASKSVTDSILNIYRYGYYYYENRFEGQVFANDIIPSAELMIDHTQPSGRNGIKMPSVENGVLTYRTAAPVRDPWIRYNVNFLAADYDYLEVTLRATDISSAAEIFIIAGSHTTYTSDQVKSLNLIEDNEFHTYRIPLIEYKDYAGTVKGIRLDINTLAGGTVEISEMKVYKADYDGAGLALSIQRSFHTYSDKLHHLVQFSTTETVEGIESVGMITEIPANTVDKIIVKDKQGIKETLDKVHWVSTEYVGFDIKDVGIFGYILPFDNNSGTIKVTLENDVYTITQTVYPAEGKLIPSVEGTRNKNDLFFGQRIYNDETHDFEAFIHEAECERHPLTAENIKVDTRYDSADFVGYNALYGYYKFTVKGTGFNPAYYNYPNKQYMVSFSVTGDERDRDMYFCTYTTAGGLESAVLLDGKNMLLPVPIEVAKNFAGDGENTVYNLDDAAYGETFFPMVINSGETKEYRLINLYQNWGLFPLKQISSIQFHTPYYHLSTGVTETNCIVPLATAGPGLPDHRAMSAPFWPTQPQHNSGGGHAFLRYTDIDGNYSASENTTAAIDAYGPTYCDITLGYETHDGAISATYTHTEMPQIDENRAFYEMKYVFNKDVEFKNFAEKFTIYNVTDNNPKGTYKQVGYLNENNEPVVIKAMTESGTAQKYVLGDECPYISFFDMPDYDKEYKHAFGYTNLSLLVYNYEIIVNGEKVDANLLLTHTLNYVKLSINLGEVTFKAGDTITLNMILMPWGSQESDYSGEEPDFNVREVRRNTLLNPLKATANKDCEVLESVFVPKVKTTNGKSAEFTLSGGNDNVTVRAYGFDMLTVPIIEEYVDGKWVPYAINSITQPDAFDFGYHYDGYMVHYDGDGTYSYSFVAKMDNGTPRTFRLSMDEDFEGWPDVEPPYTEEKEPDPINVYVDTNEFLQLSIGHGSISKTEMAEDDSYIRFYANTAASEAYVTAYSLKKDEYKNVTSTGQYIVFKYRLPKGYDRISNFEFFTSTEAESATGANDRMQITDVVQNDQWQVLIIDAAKAIPAGFKANEDGTYLAKFLRVDFLNGRMSTNDMYIDIAYLGFCDSLEKLIEFNVDVKTVTFVDGKKTTIIDTSTGKEFVEPEPVYVDPESGYTMNEVPFAGWLDYLNGTGLARGTAFDRDVSKINHNGTTIAGSYITLSGWVMAEGGIEKYVWSADGGKTWNDVVLYKKDAIKDAYPEHATNVPNISTNKYQIKDVEGSKANVGFQGSATGEKSGGIAADLSDYVGETVNLCFAAVPKANPKTLCVMLYVKNIEVLAPIEAESEVTE